MSSLLKLFRGSGGGGGGGGGRAAKNSGKRPHDGDLAVTPASTSAASTPAWLSQDRSEEASSAASRANDQDSKRPSRKQQKKQQKQQQQQQPPQEQSQPQPQRKRLASIRRSLSRLGSFRKPRAAAPADPETTASSAAAASTSRGSGDDSASSTTVAAATDAAAATVTDGGDVSSCVTVINDGDSSADVGKKARKEDRRRQEKEQKKQQKRAKKEEKCRQEAEQQQHQGKRPFFKRFPSRRRKCSDGEAASRLAAQTSSCNCTDATRLTQSSSSQLSIGDVTAVGAAASHRHSRPQPPPPLPLPLLPLPRRLNDAYNKQQQQQQQAPDPTTTRAWLTESESEQAYNRTVRQLLPVPSQPTQEPPAEAVEAPRPRRYSHIGKASTGDGVGGSAGGRRERAGGYGGGGGSGCGGGGGGGGGSSCCRSNGGAARPPEEATADDEATHPAAASTMLMMTTEVPMVMNAEDSEESILASNACDLADIRRRWTAAGTAGDTDIDIMCGLPGGGGRRPPEIDDIVEVGEAANTVDSAVDCEEVLDEVIAAAVEELDEASATSANDRSDIKPAEKSSASSSFDGGSERASRATSSEPGDDVISDAVSQENDGSLAASSNDGGDFVQGVDGAESSVVDCFISRTVPATFSVDSVLDNNCVANKEGRVVPCTESLVVNLENQATSTAAIVGNEESQVVNVVSRHESQQASSIHGVVIRQEMPTTSSLSRVVIKQEPLTTSSIFGVGIYLGTQAMSNTNDVVVKQEPQTTFSIEDIGTKPGPHATSNIDEIFINPETQTTYSINRVTIKPDTTERSSFQGVVINQETHATSNVDVEDTVTNQGSQTTPTNIDDSAAVSQEKKAAFSDTGAAKLPVIASSINDVIDQANETTASIINQQSQAAPSIDGAPVNQAHQATSSVVDVIECGRVVLAGKAAPAKTDGNTSDGGDGEDAAAAAERLAKLLLLLRPPATAAGTPAASDVVNDVADAARADNGIIVECSETTDWRNQPDEATVEFEDIPPPPPLPETTRPSGTTPEKDNVAEAGLEEELNIGQEGVFEMTISDTDELRGITIEDAGAAEPRAIEHNDCAAAVRAEAATNNDDDNDDSEDGDSSVSLTLDSLTGGDQPATAPADETEEAEAEEAAGPPTIQPVEDAFQCTGSVECSFVHRNLLDDDEEAVGANNQEFELLPLRESPPASSLSSSLASVSPAATTDNEEEDAEDAEDNVVSPELPPPPPPDTIRTLFVTFQAFDSARASSEPPGSAVAVSAEAEATAVGNDSNSEDATVGDVPEDRVQVVCCMSADQQEQQQEQQQQQQQVQLHSTRPLASEEESCLLASGVHLLQEPAATLTARPNACGLKFAEGIVVGPLL